MPADPLRLFQRWFDDARQGDPGYDETAMTLATATPDGAPSARMVLLKGVDAEGFAFYTNYRSRKARELEANPRAALVFHWPGRDRQVRVEGKVERLSAGESDAYFATRAVRSRLGAWASPQSDVIDGREPLERALRGRVAEFRHEAVPRPPFWGGYRVRPERIEFWQGRPNRLHDRLRYVRERDGGWRIERLAP